MSRLGFREAEATKAHTRTRTPDGNPVAVTSGRLTTVTSTAHTSEKSLPDR